jgi:hypothetical protein
MWIQSSQAWELQHLSASLLQERECFERQGRDGRRRTKQPKNIASFHVLPIQKIQVIFSP